MCAADPLGTSTSTARDSCEGDSGGPLLVPDGGFFRAGRHRLLARHRLRRPRAPRRLHALGDGPLNHWVHSRTPEADFDLSHQPRAGEPVTLTSTSRHPEGADYFTTFRWDLDNDGAFDDATGKRDLARLPEPRAQAVAGLEASTARRRQGVDLLRVRRRARPRTRPGTHDADPGRARPSRRRPRPAPLATILAAKRPKVKRGHFPIRVRFAKTAPKGTAVIEVYRGGRRIGIARTKVKRGATKRVRVKLTRSGRRVLSRSSTHRLKIRVRVRVGRTILRTKRLTIRR